MNTEHAKCDTCEVSCDHCGSTQTLAPMPVACLVDVVRGFLLMHRRCEKPVEPSPQLPLPGTEAAPRSYSEPADTDSWGGIDANTDEPDPETDPPGPDPFAVAYPMARDHEKLRADLAVVLQGVLVPTREQLGRHHPSTGVFDAIAHWTRLELARMNRESHPDLDIPTPLPMPEKLAEMRSEIGTPAKKKRGARPLTSKKGKG